MNRRPGIGLDHEPALDGMRAVAVAVVLLFHADVSWMRGGYIGVSVFFTLSGFLITRLLLTEHHLTGRIALGQFYARRARRLVPASLVCVAGVVVGAWLGWFTIDESLRRDVVGAILQVANWVSLGGSDSYADLLRRISDAPSPLAHYWSLAIEEQFYWLWPLVLLVLLRRAPSPSAVLRRIAGVTLAVAVIGVWIAVRFGPDAAYWSTPSRAGEILVGATLAAALFGRPVGRRAAWCGPPALVAIIAAAAVFPVGSGPAYQGLMPLFALISAGLIVALLTDGPVRSLLRTPTLVACGRVSYGLYLYHWPVFLVLDEARTGLGGIALLNVRLAITAALATASFVLLEAPIRGRAWSPRLTAGLAVATVGAMLATAATMTVADVTYWRAGRTTTVAGELRADPPGPLGPGEPAQPTQLGGPTATVVPVMPVMTPQRLLTASPPLVPDRPIRVIVVGDSTAEATGAGLLAWAGIHPELASVGIRTSPGCGMMLEGVVPADGADDFTTPCREVLERQLPLDIATLHPDVIVIQVTLRDLVDRVWSDDEGVLTPFDARFRDRLTTAYRSRTADLLAHGVARVVWVVPPTPDMYWDPGTSDYEDPARFAIQREAIEATVASHPGTARVVDLAGWLDAAGIATDHAVRPDGLHWAPEAAQQIAEDWLGQQLIEAVLT
ncbi:MAG: acyltransferase family protein [Acidimicrobiia bacterium]